MAWGAPRLGVATNHGRRAQPGCRARCKIGGMLQLAASGREQVLGRDAPDRGVDKLDWVQGR